MSQLLTPEQVARSATQYLQQVITTPDWDKIEQYLTELLLSQSRSAYEEAIQAALAQRSTVSGGMFAMAHRERDETVENVIESIKALKANC